MVRAQRRSLAAGSPYQALDVESYHLFDGERHDLGEEIAVGALFKKMLNALRVLVGSARRCDHC